VKIRAEATDARLVIVMIENGFYDVSTVRISSVSNEQERELAANSHFFIILLLLISTSALDFFVFSVSFALVFSI
jgi:E3 ubiquitin-protein ligase DOA10